MSKIWRPVTQDSEQGLIITSPTFRKIKGSFVFWVDTDYQLIVDPQERGGLRCLVFGRHIPWHWIYFNVLRWSDSGKMLFVAPVSGDWERVIGSVERQPGIPDRWIYPANPFVKGDVMEDLVPTVEAVAEMQGRIDRLTVALEKSEWIGSDWMERAKTAEEQIQLWGKWASDNGVFVPDYLKDALKNPPKKGP